MTPVDVLAKAIETAAVYGRIGGPGSIIKLLSPSEREKLAELKSDDSARMLYPGGKV